MKASEFRQNWKGLFLSLSLLTLCLFTSTVFGQSPTGDIQGTVTDTTGAVVANAKVTITEATTGRTIQTTTNSAGLYSVLHLLPGRIYRQN